ncbi:hypothetical protein CB0940_04753 [Cercospora beticola]|uniref:Uncharacterized protein n=1 Tax=Cercospora beticola TaxID=122368 RepID=A0A2G5HLA5_CERBT|nr:hypothetical protein CB0940_04753 [Cercospora beticola]PIA93003.1 hypothetical protein CB0940_04753 [Cercospora beticola]WPB02018.1 hypothetical protein RHO25_006652 [Cercospora beticola]CAK1363131.1 unnamed protein product [Cercospora beticola]
MQFFTTAFAALVASSALAAPLQLKTENDISNDINKRIAPVAAGIFGAAAGSATAAVLTGATKGTVSGTVKTFANKLFGNNEKRDGGVDIDGLYLVQRDAQDAEDGEDEATLYNLQQ